MTSGVTTTGNYGACPGGTKRTWSGGDGRRTTWFTVARPEHVQVLYGFKLDAFGKRRRYIQDSWVVPARLRCHTNRAHDAWNAYTVNAFTVNATANKVGWCGADYVNKVSDLVFDNASAVALQGELVSAVRGHQFNLAVAGAEYGKTLEMIGSTVLRLASSIRHLKRGDVPGALRILGQAPRKGHNVQYTRAPRIFLGRGKSRAGKARVRALEHKDVSALWLEMHYGWMPLLQDVHAGAEALAAVTNPPRVSRLTVSKSIHDTRVETWVQNNNGAVITAYRRCTRTYVAELRESLSAPRALGLMDPLTVAWELVPFSFVADWFIPIGGYLENLNALPNLAGRFLTMDRTTMDENESGRGVYVGTTGRLRRTVYTRTPSSSLVPIKPHFKPLGLSLGHFENGLALLSQLTK